MLRDTVYKYNKLARLAAILLGSARQLRITIRNKLAVNFIKRPVDLYTYINSRCISTPFTPKGRNFTRLRK